MSGPNHIVGGTVFTGLYLSMWNQNIFGQPHLLFFTAFFALLPDIDHTKSLIGKPFFPIAVFLDKKFGHRTITHSILCYLFLALITGITETILNNAYNTPEGEKGIITSIFLWAYASHLIFDMLTIQGVPLFYPFKKNPCVIPGNPKYRFRSLDFKSESVIFVVFVLIAFSCQGLFANGFWNTYNSSFGTVKHLHNEQLLSDKAIEVNYHFSHEGKEQTGTGHLISSTESEAILFDQKSGFVKIKATDRSNKLHPVRSNKILTFQELYFSNISYDSLLNLIGRKPIRSLKLQSKLPMQFIKDNKPQSSTSIELDNCYNPLLQSQDIDSMDFQIQKEIELMKVKVFQNNAEKNIYLEAKINANHRLIQIQNDINSDDLATKEKAIKDLQKAKSDFENVHQNVDQSKALQLQLAFLQSKLYIKKQQAINGYISYYLIQ
jgi:inner membrane protein